MKREHLPREARLRAGMRSVLRQARLAAAARAPLLHVENCGAAPAVPADYFTARQAMSRRQKPSGQSMRSTAR